MRKQRQVAFAGATIAAILLAGGCGTDGNSADGGDKVQPAADSEQAGSDYGSGGYGSAGGNADDAKKPAGKPGAAAKELAVREAPELGPIVTDSKGVTLYRFDEDSAGPSKSACVGGCAKTWPPVPADDATATAGIKAALLGAVARKDGTRQLTLGGWPVYRYSLDTKVGDTKGHGIGGTWNALAPDGKKAGQAAAEAPEQQPEKPADELSTTDDAKLGKILVDGKARTLYRFNKDSAWPMKFGCVGACLDTWKPAKPVLDKTKVSGVADKLITTLKRPDGTQQLAIDCWPVYWFTGDEKPGDTNGQGKQGLWFAVSPDGKKVGAGATG
ncbi:SCO0930 family lipoprotein [Streptomyces sp. H27-D2]|uniref:SCO0930 family lipoprotein n=1 Tax=Streptomyces sp. H27-D2 TaxID=3046304 RepID=UPI002DBB47EA|nr:SCO0930 family lipoprotein [Streptomyces sp. H27-D2]MEC4019571.1 SCO0930 family lipoprotein [Streptomyces sp. H27-D2]